MDLEEAYRSYAREHYTTKTTQTEDTVTLAPGGAWVTMRQFIPSWELGHGWAIDIRERWEAETDADDVEALKDIPGRYALWDLSKPESPILGDQYEALVAQLLTD